MDKARAADYLHPLEPIPTAQQAQGRLKAPIACLLCDIYGTLFISGSGEGTGLISDYGRTDAFARLLKCHGIETPPEQIIDQLALTIARHHSSAIAGGNRYPEVCIEAVWREVLSIPNDQRLKQFAFEFEMLTNPVWPMPHLPELLNHCRRMHIRLGIISNAQFYTPLLFPLFFQRDIRQLGFDPELVVFSFEYKTAKPAPLLFAKAMEKLHQRGIPVAQVAFIGNDMRNDMLPAQRAGFQTILFAGDARSLRLRRDDPRCRVFNPDAVITDLSQLILLLTDPGKPPL